MSRRTSTTVVQDYLRAIYCAGEWGDDGIGVTELATLMGVSASTASENVRKLRDQGLVSHRPYQRVRLTEDGHRLAVTMVRRHRMIETVLHDLLGYSWDEVHDEAESLEHAVTNRLIDRIDHVLGYPEFDPHGDPIPRADGTVPAGSHCTLDIADEATTVRVTRIRDADPELLRHCEARGIVPGSELHIVERNASTGIITVEVISQGKDPVVGTRIDLPIDLGADIRVRCPHPPGEHPHAHATKTSSRG